MAFPGARLYLSRTLLPPDLIHRLQDVLTNNGAVVYHCCDPAARSPDDFHVLFSPDSDKSRELQAHGCQVVGPNCVFQCAERRRPLPKRSSTCCFALEGLRVFLAGFDSEEKVNLELLVTAAFGSVETIISSTTDFVVAKTVLSPEYQLACSLSKPVVTLSWLETCCREHRLVLQEPYRLPPFSGLVVCATQVLSVERKRISDAVKENGGLYTPDLRKDCTHLIAKIPDGKKYDVAKSWGSVKVVNEAWLWQSLSTKACLNEEAFAVPARVSHVTSSSADAAGVSHVTSSSADAAACDLKHEDEQLNEHSTAEPSDLYLANCRFYILGYETEDMKRVVDLVLDGGGTRYMEFNNTVSHVVIGPSPHSEVKSIMKKASCGAVQVVAGSWLEECAQERREVFVAGKHAPRQRLQNETMNDLRYQKPLRAKSLNVSTGNDTNEEPQSLKDLKADKNKNVFANAVFSFLETFPASGRQEVIGWIGTGGGSVSEHVQEAHYLIGVHGLSQAAVPPSSVVVSIHWIRQCIEASRLLDTREHVIYRPLSCRVPLPGFEKLRICISQYSDTERLHCRLLCHLLGSKYTDKLTKKATHLLCKEGDGEKYQVAKVWGLRVATIEWLYACIAQNAVVSSDNFLPAASACSPAALVAPAEEQAASQKHGSVKRKLPSKKRTDSQKRLATDGGCFDAWEELTASWSSGDVSLVMKEKPEESESQNGDQLLRRVELVPEMPADTNQNIDMHPKDVATCIEGLLGQQKKAVEGNSDEDSDETPDRSRLSERSFECEDASKLVNNPSGEQKYDESQIYSQVVSYDVDHCAGKHVMEKMHSTSTKLQKKFPKSFLSTKKLGLGRLLEAAEANK